VILVNTDQQKDWRSTYRAALLELDPAKLAERIDEACKAIQLGIDWANQTSNAAEHQALADALANLRVLRRELLPPTSNHKATKFPASNPQYGCDQ
jgi:hypothetical protein